MNLFFIFSAKNLWIFLDPHMLKIKKNFSENKWFHFPYFLYLYSSQLTYTVVLTSGVEPSDSLLTYDAHGPTGNVSSLLPVIYLTHSSTHPPSSNPEFVLCI